MLPVLASVPSVVGDPLTLKLTVSGVVSFEKSFSANTFHSRYTGNKYSCVDINGNLWLKKTELQKQLKQEQVQRSGVTVNKKPRVKTQGGQNKLIMLPEKDRVSRQISEMLSTNPDDLLTNLPELSPPPPQQYAINKKEVRQRVMGYINTVRGKKHLYFWTVTFPKQITDDIGYKCMNTWLTGLRQYRMLKNYLWVAERQPQTGAVHFHIAIPHRMCIKKANAMMRGTLKNAIRRGEIDYSEDRIRKYNGIDIAKNRKTGKVTNFAIKKGGRSLATYLTKYVTKNNGTFKHLAWHNSRGYSGIFTGITFTWKEFSRLGIRFYLETDKDKWLITEHFTYVPWKDGPPRFFNDHLFKLNSFLQEQLN